MLQTTLKVDLPDTAHDGSILALRRQDRESAVDYKVHTSFEMAFLDRGRAGVIE